MASLVSTIQAALASVAASLPDAVRTMTHGTETGDAISVSSVEIGGEAASDSGAVEKSRVIVTAANFPTLDRDDLVTLSSSKSSQSSQSSHIVTSLKTDPVAASATVGLSEALSKVFADYFGTRGSRPIRFPVEILAENNGLATDIADGYAPTTVHSWTLCIAVDSWPENGEPQIGDEVRFEKDGEDIRVKVARCNRRERHYVISARSR